MIDDIYTKYKEWLFHNFNCFIRALNDDKLVVSLMWDGREFHSLEADGEKEL